MGFFDQFPDFGGYLQQVVQQSVAGQGDSGYQPMPQSPPEPPQQAPPPFANVMPSQQAPAPPSGGIGSDQPPYQPPGVPLSSPGEMAGAQPRPMPQQDSGGPMPSPGGNEAPPWMQPAANGQQAGAAAGGFTPPTAAPPPSPPFTPTAANEIYDKYQAAGGGRDVSGAPQGQNGGFLQNALGLTPDKTKQMMAGIAKGAAGITGNGRFASFARGAGQGIQGAQAEENTQYDQKLKALNAAITARKAGDMDAYKTNYLKYLGQKEQNKTDAATNKPTAWNKPPAQRFLDAQRLFTQQQHSLYLELGLNNKDMKPEDRAKALQEYTARSTKLQGDILGGVGLSPQDAANMAKNPPGTQPNPHAPTSKQDFDAYVKPGDYYKNPRDGQIYMRKTDAAPGGKAEAPSARPDEAEPPLDPMNPSATASGDIEQPNAS